MVHLQPNADVMLTYGAYYMSAYDAEVRGTAVFSLARVKDGVWFHEVAHSLT
jgi:hypothetical protein